MTIWDSTNQKKLFSATWGSYVTTKIFSRIMEKLNPFPQLLKVETPINLMSELKEMFDSVNKVFSYACELALKHHLPEKHSALMTDAIFRCSANALKVEDMSEQTIQNRESKRKVYAPVAFRSNFSYPAQLKLSIYSEVSLAH